MRLLLDTHTFLWFVLNDPQLSELADSVICDPANQVEISPASYWELAIKISLGKYLLREPLSTFLRREIAANAMRILPIEPDHAAAVATLPFHHRDPFDRLLLAQAIVEQIPIVCADHDHGAYGVNRLW